MLSRSVCKDAATPVDQQLMMPASGDSWWRFTAAQKKAPHGCSDFDPSTLLNFSNLCRCLYTERATYFRTARFSELTLISLSKAHTFFLSILSSSFFAQPSPFASPPQPFRLKNTWGFQSNHWQCASLWSKGNHKICQPNWNIFKKGIKSYVMEDLTFKNTLANCNTLIYKFCQVHTVLLQVLLWLPTIILVLTSTSIRQSGMWVGFPYWLETFNSYSRFSHVSGTVRERKSMLS